VCADQLLQQSGPHDAHGVCADPLLQRGCGTHGVSIVPVAGGCGRAAAERGAHGVTIVAVTGLARTKLTVCALKSMFFSLEL